MVKENSVDILILGGDTYQEYQLLIYKGDSEYPQKKVVSRMGEVTYYKIQPLDAGWSIKSYFDVNLILYTIVNDI